MYSYSIIIEVFSTAASGTPSAGSPSAIGAPSASSLPSDIFGEFEGSYRTSTGIKLVKHSNSKRLRSTSNSLPLSSGVRDYRLGNVSIEWIDLRDTEADMSADDEAVSSATGNASLSWARTSRSVSQSSSSAPILQPSPGASSFSMHQQQQHQKDGSSSDENGTASSLMAELVAAQREASTFGLNPNSSSRTKKRTNAPIVPTSGIFIPFKSGKSKLNAGIVHLYRDRQEIEDVGSEQAIPADDTSDIKGSGTVLCILAVPSYMTTQDLLAFVGPTRKSISHLRIVRDSLPNRYMVLAKFRDARSAERFKNMYDGKQFNSLESEVAHVVYVKSVQFKSRSIPPYAFPPIPEFTTTSVSSNTSNNNSNHDSESKPNTSTSVTTATNRSAPPPGLTLTKTTNAAPTAAISTTDTPSTVSTISTTLSETCLNKSSDSSKHIPSTLVELPTCPVCLERMDASATGLLTIICHHTFHCSCLAKWGDSSCPVCRYTQQPKGPGLRPSEDEEPNECAQCGATEDLWICLVCGHIGCGRYRRAHAREHFQNSQHLYALELETQRVWDYAGDGYVHRLIQNRADGKLVELPPPNTDRSRQQASLASNPTNVESAHLGTRNNSNSPNRNDGNDKNIDELGVEYGYLLATQLESQRIWYEAQLNTIRTDSDSQIHELVASLSAERQARERAEAECQRVNDELPSLLADRKAYDKKLEKLVDRVVSLERTLADEKQLNIGLRDNQTQWRLQIETRDKLLKERDLQVKDLQEQLRDVMFYLETQQTVEQSGIKDEIASGQLIITNNTPSSSSKKKGKTAKR